LLNSTVLFRNGVKLFHGFSSMCDSRYKGIHVITQGQIEKVYIRDLKRAGVLVEREVVVDNFEVHEKVEEGGEGDIHPVKAELRNIHTGRTESVHAKYLIGADGASSMTREMMGIPFDGVTTDCYWTIMDCQFKTDFPHILGFW
jgi:phenol 2-monooxygenase